MAALTEIGTAVVRNQRMRLEVYGDQLLFYVKALASTPRAVRHYRREIWSILGEVTFGAGGLSMIAGTVGVRAGSRLQRLDDRLRRLGRRNGCARF